MKREEKNLQTRRRIIDSALGEFGEKSYAEASLNTICSAGDISKGIIYHYFKDKDELYLVCLKECFDELTAYLSERAITGGDDVRSCLQNYFDARIAFFGEHPLYLKLFCSAVITPPQHLREAITAVRSEFDRLSITVLTGLLGKVRLRPGITVAEVVDDFRLYQDYFNTRYQLEHPDAFSLAEHEARCHRSLNILLYGIIDQGR
jgi:AcrR family transcriptional regulator